MKNILTMHLKLALIIGGVLTLPLSAFSGQTGSEAIQERASPVFKLNKKSAARMLNQATFGATRDSVLALRRLGSRGWLNEQFSLPITQTHLDRISTVDYKNRVYPEGMFGVMDGAEYIVNNTWQSYITAKDQLRKRVGYALHQIFVINARVSNIGIKSNQNAAASFLDMLEINAFGNFRNTLYDVSRHAAMSHYLSYYDNRKATYNGNGVALTIPDENYAREVLQLFSIGLHELNNDGTLKLNAQGKPQKTYTQKDILNLARVFTGWRYIKRSGYSRKEYALQKFNQPLIVDSKKHSPERKQFLGAVIPANTDAYKSLNKAIDTIFNHPNVGPFISKQLIQRLVTSNPSKGYVYRVASVFNNNANGVRGDMRSVIQAILLDDEATQYVITSLSNIRGKLREPMIRLTAVARMLGYTHYTKIYPIGNLSDTSHGLAQSPFKSPSVFNFFRPGYTPPNSTIATMGYVAPEFQIVTGSAISGSINLINEFINRGEDVFNADWFFLNRKARNPQKLITDLNIHLTAKTMSIEEINTALSVINKIPVTNRKQRVKAALQIVAASPSFLIQK